MAEVVLAGLFLLFGYLIFKFNVGGKLMEEEAKKPVIVLLHRDGMMSTVVTDTPGCVEVLHVNVVSPGSPQDGVQELKLKMPEGEDIEMNVAIIRLGVKSPPREDTVVAQFKAACPPGEYDIQRTETHKVRQYADGRVEADDGEDGIQPDGTMKVALTDPIRDFVKIYEREFGETPDPVTFMKYMPRRD